MKTKWKKTFSALLLLFILCVNEAEQKGKKRKNASEYW